MNLESSMIDYLGKVLTDLDRWRTLIHWHQHYGPEITRRVAAQARVTMPEELWPDWVPPVRKRQR